MEKMGGITITSNNRTGVNRMERKVSKVNKELYRAVKEVILRGNYTVEEVSCTLHWIRMENANKRNNVVDEIRVRDIENQEDCYGPGHIFEDGPDRE